MGFRVRACSSLSLRSPAAPNKPLTLNYIDSKPSNLHKPLVFCQAVADTEKEEERLERRALRALGGRDFTAQELKGSWGSCWVLGFQKFGVLGGGGGGF